MSNLHTHLTLRSLRPEGSRKRAIPHGYGFDLVSFPNYFFEILGWAVIAVMTGSIAGNDILIQMSPARYELTHIYSHLFYYCFYCDDVCMGSQETNNLPEGIRRGVP